MRKTVIEPWKAKYAKPLVVKAGEVVSVGKADTEWPFHWCTSASGNTGWLPTKCLSIEGTTARCLYDYSTAELSVDIGEQVVSESEDSGWSWVRNQTGQNGWVPNRCLASAIEQS